MSTELVIGAPGGVVTTIIVRVPSDPKSRWNGELLRKFKPSFEQAIDPSERFPDRVQIETGVVAHGQVPPEVDTCKSGRRIRLAPSDFIFPWLHCRLPGVR